MTIMRQILPDRIISVSLPVINQSINSFMPSKHIVFLVIPDSTLLDITGPYEVFAQASSCIRNSKERFPFEYKLHTLSVTDERLVKTASGFSICCDKTLDSFCEKIDTLIVPGFPNDMYVELDNNVLQRIKQESLSARRICSVCTGTFFLAATGILNGKKAVTHWEMCDKLAEKYPAIRVERDPIFVKDGKIYSSAGISSGIDLALALIEEDCGRSTALEVAKQMVLYLKRSGNQSQFSMMLKHQDTDYRPIHDIIRKISDKLNEKLTVEKLAEEVSMSPRNFARIFVREIGITPGRYIEKLRVETACHYLVETRLTLKEIAAKCGLDSIDNMRRQFVKHLQITPSAYRINFKTAFDGND